MNSPRLHSNLRPNAADCDKTSGNAGDVPHTAESNVQALSPADSDFRTFSAHSEGQFPHISASAIREFESRLDRTMRRLVLDLSTISQVKAAQAELQAADSNAWRLPVSPTGRALTDDPAGQFAREYERAATLGDLKRRIKLKVDIAVRAQTELRQCRYSRRHAPDLGTQDGRLAVARYAREHGTRRAAETYCQNPDDPRSVKQMQRNAQRYLVELDRIESIR